MCSSVRITPKNRPYTVSMSSAETPSGVRVRVAPCPLMRQATEFKEDTTMTDTKYNGWTNYATWRINLEIFDGFDPIEAWGLELETLTKSELAALLREDAEELVNESAPEGLALSYAMSFLSEVNWHEIASHMLEDY